MNPLKKGRATKEKGRTTSIANAKITNNKERLNNERDRGGRNANQICRQWADGKCNNAYCMNKHHQGDSKCYDLT